jgi:hypothetical protein
LERYRRREWLTWPRLALLLVIPVLTFVFTLNGDLLRSYQGINPQTGSVIYQNGVWFFVYITYSYLVYLAGGIIFVASMRSSPLLYARQTGLALAGMIFFLVLDGAFQYGRLSFLGQNPAPALMWVTTLLLALAIFASGCWI